MPWKSLPATGTAATKNKLAQACHITGIPALIVLDRKTGNFITDTARTDVEGWKQAGGGSKEAAEQVVAKWKNVESVPLADAKLGGGSSGGVMKIVMMITKNPAFIFGLIYLVKVRRMEWPCVAARRLSSRRALYSNYPRMHVFVGCLTTGIFLFFNGTVRVAPTEKVLSGC